MTGVPHLHPMTSVPVRTDHPILRLQLVAALHKPGPGQGPGKAFRYCGACQDSWPCATFEAVTGDVDVAELELGDVQAIGTEEQFGIRLEDGTIDPFPFGTGKTQAQRVCARDGGVLVRRFVTRTVWSEVP